MKQMRSRFRFLTLLLVCGFLLTLVLCAGSVLKEMKVSSALQSLLPTVSVSPAPEPSVLPDAFPASETLPAAPDVSPSGIDPSDTDNSPLPEYNVFGL